MDFFIGDNAGHIGFGGNVSGTLNPSEKKSGITKARIKESFGRFQVSAPPFIWGVAGGYGAAETVTITGKVATSISVRAKSHSSLQKVVVTVS